MKKNEVVMVCLLGLPLLGCTGDAAPPPCVDNDDCAIGHACEFSQTAETGGETTGDSGGEDTEMPGVCSEYCMDELCADAREECSSLTSPQGLCIFVNCGRTVACPAADEYCDVALHRCHPLSGECSQDSNCPSFGPNLDVSCDVGTGLCHVSSPIITSLPGNELPETITWRSPEEGEIVASSDELKFSWTTTEAQGGFFVWVFAGRPPSVVESSDFIIWGAAAGSGFESVSWAQGASIEDGVWSSESSLPPTGTALYALVIRYQGGDAVASSTLRSFFVGSGGWAAPGDPCPTSALTIPGGCDNPNVALGCEAGICRTICASDLDCYLDGLSCGPPEPSSGLRYCI